MALTTPPERMNNALEPDDLGWVEDDWEDPFTEIEEYWYLQLGTEVCERKVQEISHREILSFDKEEDLRVHVEKGCVDCKYRLYRSAGGNCHSFEKETK